MKHHPAFVFAVLAVALLVFSSVPCCAVVYVKWDSPGPTFDGNSWDTAFQTVQAGLNAATSDDEVWVARGIYVQCINLRNGADLYGGFLGTETSRNQRDPKENETVLDGNQQGSAVTCYGRVTDGAVIDGFTVRNGRSTQSYTNGGGIYCYGSAPTISNNTIMGNSAYYGGGICCNTGPGPTIVNNRIIGNSASFRGGGILCSVSQAVITNNTIVGNYPYGVTSSAASPRVSNNIVAFNVGAFIKFNSGMPILRNNCLYGNKYGYESVAVGPGDIWTEDPLLVDPEYGDIHIQVESPCRDAGWNEAPGIPAVDIDGQPRVQGGTVDIGADESDGTVWNPKSHLIIRVSPSGDDENDGSTWELAKKTVQAGIDAASPHGGEVWVETGTYAERVILRQIAYVYGGFAGREESRSERDWKTNETILDGQGAGPVVTASFAGHMLSAIDGFTIRNGNAADFGGGVHCDNCSIAIRNDNIVANQAPNGGGVGCYYSCSTIAHCTITGNSSTGDWWLAGGGGISCVLSTSTIANNRIMENEAVSRGGGIFSDGSVTIVNNVISRNIASNGGGIYGPSSSPVIAFNTITDNEAPYSGGGVYCGPVSPRISNNIIAFNTSGIYGSMTVATLSRNCMYANERYDYSGVNPGADDVSFDPLFVDRGNGDFRLRWYSPCVDRGMNDGCPLTDILGHPRPTDGDWDGIAVADIGAYEYMPCILDIDVLPGNDQNIVRLKDNRMITVAVYGSADFDVSTIDPDTVKFGPGDAIEVHKNLHLEDVNGDGIMDLILHFRCTDTGLQVGDTSVSLHARLLAGDRAEGSDSVTVVAR